MAAVPETIPATTNLADLRASSTRDLAVSSASSHSGGAVDFFTPMGFDLMQRVAKAFASSTLVPQTYQGNVANCMIALNLARRMKADELMVMQNLYIVHGNPGWSAKFLIACVNMSGRFTALRYEWTGTPGTDDYGCRAWARENKTGDRLDGIWVTWAMVKAEGWNAKNGSKWKTPLAQQMFIYRAATFWQRAYAPEISMGLSTVEELHDVVDVNEDGSYTVTTESLRTTPNEFVMPAEPAAAVARAEVADAPAPIAGEEVAPPAAPAASSGSVTSYASLRDQLEKARDADELNDLASLIDSTASNKKHAAELLDVFRARRAALGGDA